MRRRPQKRKAPKPPSPSQPPIEPVASAIDWRTLAVVFFLTVSVRFLYFATADGPSFQDPLIDGDYYDYLGGRLATGEGFEPGPYWQPPLYPMVLGWLYGALGQDLTWPRLLQACLDGVTSVLVVRIAMEAIKHRWFAIAAGGVVALHGTLVFYSGEILPTTLALTLSTLAVWFVVDGPRSVHRAAACGLAIGMGALAVATTAVLVIPMALLAARENRRYGWVVLGVCLAVVGTATLSNRMRSGEWIPISANGGINLYLGNAAESERLTAIRPGAAWETLVNEPARAGITSPSGQDAYFVRKAAAWCAAEPLDCVAGFASKARLLLRSKEIPRNESVEVVRDQSSVLRVVLARAGPVALPHALLLPFAAAGGVWAFRKRRHASTVVVWATLALASMPVLFFVTGRYRTAMASGLAVLAVLGARALWLDRRAAWREALAAVIVLVFAVWPAPRLEDEVNYEAEMYYAVGGRRARLGDDAGAVGSWKQAIALRPDYLEAHFNLGLAYVRAERWELAARAFRTVVQLDPGNEMAREVLEACEARVK